VSQDELNATPSSESKPREPEALNPQAGKVVFAVLEGTVARLKKKRSPQDLEAAVDSLAQGSSTPVQTDTIQSATVQKKSDTPTTPPSTASTPQTAPTQPMVQAVTPPSPQLTTPPPESLGLQNASSQASSPPASIPRPSPQSKLFDSPPTASINAPVPNSVGLQPQNAAISPPPQPAAKTDWKHFIFRTKSPKEIAQNNPATSAHAVRKSNIPYLYAAAVLIVVAIVAYAANHQIKSQQTISAKLEQDRKAATAATNNALNALSGPVFGGLGDSSVPLATTTQPPPQTVPESGDARYEAMLEKIKGADPVPSPTAPVAAQPINQPPPVGRPLTPPSTSAPEPKPEATSNTQASNPATAVSMGEPVEPRKTVPARIEGRVEVDPAAVTANLAVYGDVVSTMHHARIPYVMLDYAVDTANRVAALVGNNQDMQAAWLRVGDNLAGGYIIVRITPREIFIQTPQGGVARLQK
jgi:hypothetical protein